MLLVIFIQFLCVFFKILFLLIIDKKNIDLLLKKYTANVTDATEAQIKQAAQDTIPQVAPLFWSFRIMVGLGFFFLFVFTV